MDVRAYTANSLPNQLILEYCPNIRNMANIQRLPLVWFDRNTSFQKGTGRNRMLIAGNRGPTLLSIPILGGRSHHQMYGETRIDHRLPWKRQHWGALQSNYGKSPYWEHYAEQLAEIYAPEIELLFDWNLHLLQFFTRLMCQDTSISTEESVPLMFETPHFEADTHQNMQFPHYHQVFEQKTGFLTNLSIVDLLLNVGHPRAQLYLKNLSIPT